MKIGGWLRARLGRRDIGIALVFYGFTTAAWAWINPVFEAPDEPFHVAYANLLVREHRWPAPEDVRTTSAFMETHTGEGQFRVFEAGQSDIFLEWSQPPLYYLLQTLPLALCYPQGFRGVLIPPRPDYWYRWERGYFRHDPSEYRMWTRPLVAIRLMRLVSVALGALAVWWTARLARLTSPGSEALPVLAAALYAFIPQLTFMAATVNNDALGYLLSAIGLWSMVRGVQASWGLWKAVGVWGSCLGIGVLAKSNTLFLWPLVVIASMLAYSTWHERLLCSFGTMALGALLAWTAFFGARIALHLDLVNFAILGNSSQWFTFSTDFLGGRSQPSWAYAGRVLQMLGESFWGQFGWFQIRINQDVLAVYWVLVTVALSGWVWGRSSEVDGSRDRRACALLLASVVMAACGLALLYRNLFIPQGGRYLLAVGPAIAILFGMGLLRARRLLGERLRCRIPEQGFGWGVAALMVLLNWIVLWTSIYRPYMLAWRAAA